jgi:hypothetical protein
VVVYLALLPLWWLALGVIGAVAGLPAGWLYHFFDPQVSINPDGKIINVIATASQQSGFGGRTHSSNMRVDTITYGLPMLAALVLVTRAGSWRAKAECLALGAAVMMIITVPAVMMWAKLTSLQLDDQLAQATMEGTGDRASFFYYGFHGYAYSQPVIAVAIWIGLMMLGLFKDKASANQMARPANVARNAPCPCGSGRKYKRCCGR